MLFRRRTNKDAASAKKAKPAKEAPVAPPQGDYWETAPAAATDSDIAARSRVFDGASDQQFDFGTPEGLAAVTIDLRLRTKNIPSSAPPFDRTNPQMPLSMSDKVGIHVTEKGYFFLVKDAGGELVLKGTYGDLSRFTRLTLVSDAGGTVLYIDGTEVARSEKAVGMAGRVRLGAGQSERFWSGEVEYCDIFRVVKARTDFADRRDRFDTNGRVATTDAG